MLPSTSVQAVPKMPNTKLMQTMAYDRWTNLGNMVLPSSPVGANHANSATNTINVHLNLIPALDEGSDIEQHATDLDSWIIGGVCTPLT